MIAYITVCNKLAFLAAFGGNEFLDNLLKKISKILCDGISICTAKYHAYLLELLDFGLSRSKALAQNTPEGWNEAAFSFIKTIAEDVAIPIAGCIITFVFCYQIITLVQESNHMHTITPQTILMLLLKLGICLLVCSKSFEIVNGMFELASWATEKITTEISPEVWDIPLQELESREDLSFQFGLIMEMYANFFITFIAVIVVFIMTVSIYLRVNVWYLELLIYASLAPIPFATFMNKEWGQIGMNYVRKMFALAFQGFIMVMIFSLYGALVGNALKLVDIGTFSYLLSIAAAVGCGILLFIMLNKSGTIAASIFNAH